MGPALHPLERDWMRHLARRGMPVRRIARGFGRHRMTVYTAIAGILKRTPRTPEESRLIAKDRRDLLREHKLCINGGHHGPATHGVLCERCRETHRKSS